MEDYSSDEIILDSFQSCGFCGNYFTNDNKPRVLKCSHSICTICMKDNRLDIQCITCSAAITQTELKSSPINYTLQEQLERTSSKYNTETNDLKKKPIFSIVRDSRSNINANNLTNIKRSNRRSNQDRLDKHSISDSNALSSNELVLTSDRDKKDSGNEEISLDKCFYCDQCRILLRSTKHHHRNFPEHTFSPCLDVFKEEVSKIHQEENNILNEFKEYNLRLDSLNNNFFKTVINGTMNQFEKIVHIIKNFPIYDQFEIVGLISSKDKEYLYNLSNLLSQNPRLEELIKDAPSVDEFVTEASPILDEKTLNDFLYNYFLVEEIYEKNFSDIEEKLKLLEDRLKDEKDNDLNQVLKYFIEDVSIQIYDSMKLDSNEVIIKHPILIVNLSYSRQKENLGLCDSNLNPSEVNHLQDYFTHSDLRNSSGYQPNVLVNNDDANDIEFQLFHEIIIFDSISEELKQYRLEDYLIDIQIRDFSYCLDMHNNLYIFSGLKNGNRQTQIYSPFFFLINLKKTKYYKTIKTLPPESSFRNCVSVIARHKIFLIGGFNENDSQSNFKMYNIVTNQYKLLPNVPHKLDRNKIKVELLQNNGIDMIICVYVDIKNIFLYMIDKNMWNKVLFHYEDYQTVKLYNRSLINIKESIYLFGGYESHSILQDKERKTTDRKNSGPSSLFTPSVRFFKLDFNENLIKNARGYKAINKECLDSSRGSKFYTQNCIDSIEYSNGNYCNNYFFMEFCSKSNDVKVYKANISLNTDFCFTCHTSMNVISDYKQMK